MRDSKPWWQLANTPRTAFLLAGVWTVIALLQWFRLFGDPDGTSWIRIVLLVVSTALVPFYVVSGIKQRRRAERDDPGRSVG